MEEVAVVVVVAVVVDVVAVVDQAVEQQLLRQTKHGIRVLCELMDHL